MMLSLAQLGGNNQLRSTRSFVLFTLFNYKIIPINWNMERPPRTTVQPQGYMALAWLVN